MPSNINASDLSRDIESINNILRHNPSADTNFLGRIWKDLTGEVDLEIIDAKLSEIEKLAKEDPRSATKYLTGPLGDLENSIVRVYETTPEQHRIITRIRDLALNLQEKFPIAEVYLFDIEEALKKENIPISFPKNKDGRIDRPDWVLNELFYSIEYLNPEIRQTKMTINMYVESIKKHYYKSYLVFYNEGINKNRKLPTAETPEFVQKIRNNFPTEEAKNVKSLTISYIPPEIGHFVNLQELHLTAKQADFPSEIYKLKKLETLELSFNHNNYIDFREFPKLQKVFLQGYFNDSKLLLAGLIGLRNLKKLEFMSQALPMDLPRTLNNMEIEFVVRRTQIPALALIITPDSELRKLTVEGRGVRRDWDKNSENPKPIVDFIKDLLKEERNINFINLEVDAFPSYLNELEITIICNEDQLIQLAEIVTSDSKIKVLEIIQNQPAGLRKITIRNTPQAPDAIYKYLQSKVKPQKL